MRDLEKRLDLRHPKRCFKIGSKGDSLAIIVLPVHESDITEASKIHAKLYLNQKNSKAWIKCNLNAYPRIMIFVARDEQDKIIGYIQWAQKNGFTNQSHFELEQLAVITDKNQNTIEKLLFEKSFEHIQKYLSDSKSVLKSIVISASMGEGFFIDEELLKKHEIKLYKNLFFDEL